MKGNNLLLQYFKGILPEGDFMYQGKILGTPLITCCYANLMAEPCFCGLDTDLESPK